MYAKKTNERTVRVPKFETSRRLGTVLLRDRALYAGSVKGARYWSNLKMLDVHVGASLELYMQWMMHDVARYCSLLLSSRDA